MRLGKSVTIVGAMGNAFKVKASADRPASTECERTTCAWVSYGGVARIKPAAGQGEFLMATVSAVH